MSDRRLLTAGATPANEFRVVEHIRQDGETAVVRGRGLPTGGDVAYLNTGGSWALTALPDAYEDLDTGRYLLTRRGAGADGYAVRDVTDMGIFGTIHEAPVVLEGTAAELRRGSA